MYPSKNWKIGLFGGSFNPPHMAHTLLAQFAIKQLKLDLLIFIPSFKSVDKLEQDYLEGEERAYMLSLSKTKYLSVISTFELNLKEPVESIVTVRHFRKRFPDDELYFLIGADHCSTLNSWDGIEEIFQVTTPVIFKRKGSSTELDSLKHLDKEVLKKVIFLQNQLFPHSSTAIREQKKYRLLHKRVKRYLKNQLS
ncbi:nicotinate (nicotinamide) nucleotide adenylyltransferase [Mycoplasma wenyonii]|uniref:Probable nicotinate-nucleotide adenylyltransferase n=1 Tax=Mycoplasma wenyonii TaxID=65123 RepID=A0A328PLC9_9MOLU|nr:nicotinate (nicotinamide) nucleotide adenylyltransferase [Mycoplasma wenyonii]RAO95194.1 nicotinate (nicotinamide) nucleotide adenylyltransferase [Mycoplasma wenyonii]